MTRYDTQLNVRVPGPLRERLRACSDETGIPRSHLVAAALERFLEELEEEARGLVATLRGGTDA